jgi:hypothetical protein
MTTIHLARPSPRNPRYQVFGNYEAPDGSDRFIFGFREFDDAAHAARVAKAMVARFGAELTTD